MRVYYLTSESHAISNIENMRIKVSLFEDLNDPFELLGFSLEDQERRAVWRKFRDYFSRQVGLVCFSVQWQNPVMWSHYGDKHKGIGLGFDVSDEILKKVSYVGDRKRMQIGRSLSSHGIEPDLLSKIVRYKYNEWSYEREYRGIVPLEEKDSSGLHFVDFSESFVLREIIIGARCKRTPAGFRNLLLPYKNEVKVIKSRLAYQSFKVVKNRAIAEYRHA